MLLIPGHGIHRNSPEPAFLKNAKGKEFYVRTGNTSRTLDAEESVSYIQMNWE